MDLLGSCRPQAPEGAPVLQPLPPGGAPAAPPRPRPRAPGPCRPPAARPQRVVDPRSTLLDWVVAGWLRILDNVPGSNEIPMPVRRAWVEGMARAAEAEAGRGRLEAPHHPGLTGLAGEPPQLHPRAAGAARGPVERRDGAGGSLLPRWAQHAAARKLELELDRAARHALPARGRHARGVGAARVVSCARDARTLVE